jgi:hypothetical protein
MWFRIQLLSELSALERHMSEAVRADAAPWLQQR